LKCESKGLGLKLNYTLYKLRKPRGGIWPSLVAAMGFKLLRALMSIWRDKKMPSKMKCRRQEAVLDMGLVMSAAGKRG